ncbi:MAG: hypothetical protein KAX05_07210, partial [Bacteroidales bacterium]|nr:hypothetical protein [Bacteroidales bacterium]
MIKTEDANVALLYSRRCLEVIITDLCERELKRPRKTEPLKGLIDKLNKEEKVPSFIITSMLNLNSLSTYGAHPKEFNPRQTRTVLIDLHTVIEWYLKYKNIEPGSAEEEKEEQQEIKRPDDLTKHIRKPKKKLIIIGYGAVLIVLIIVFIVLQFVDIGGKKIDKADLRSIAVMPFQNMTGDTTYNIWEMGLQFSIINKLSNSEELSVRQPQTMFDILESSRNINYVSLTPSIASDIALKLEANTFIFGSLLKAGNKIRISAQLRDSESEEIYKSFEIDGNTEDDLFHIIDSLSFLIKNYLEIKVMKQDIDYDVNTWAKTSSPKAYRYYIQGMNL